MNENRIKLTTGLLLLVAIILAFWTLGCGGVFEEIRPNYMLNTSQEGTNRILDVVLLGIDTYNENFGICPHKVDIVMRKWGFDCGGISAAGCSYGGLVDIGVNPTSECETIRVLLHELSHACRGVKDTKVQPNWTWELNDITYQLFLDGKCKADEIGLYESYVWR